MRSFSVDALAALVASTVRPFSLFAIELASTTLYLSTLDFDLSWDSKTWLGNGQLLDPGELTEVAESAEGIEIELTGTPAALISVHMQEVRQNKPATVYRGFLDATRALIVDPVVAFDGIVSHSILSDGADEATLIFTIESALIDADRPRDLRYNHESQQVAYPGDLFFEYGEQLQNASYYWGLKKKVRKKNRNRKASE